VTATAFSSRAFRLRSETTVTFFASDIAVPPNEKDRFPGWEDGRLKNKIAGAQKRRRPAVAF
jgi:hypothetical protein